VWCLLELIAKAMTPHSRDGVDGASVDAHVETIIQPEETTHLQPEEERVIL
jgi:hypothetical protein